MIIPTTFAKEWTDAWNARDLPRLLEKYAHTIELRSPFAKLFADGSIIRNKKQLEDYWSEVMRRMADLKMEVIAVYPGVQCMTLHYREATGRNCIETFAFDTRDKVVFETACMDSGRG